MNQVKFLVLTHSPVTKMLNTKPAQKGTGTRGAI